MRSALEVFVARTPLFFFEVIFIDHKKQGISSKCVYLKLCIGFIVLRNVCTKIEFLEDPYNVKPPGKKSDTRSENLTQKSDTNFTLVYFLLIC